jgi:hypothetical protein
LVSLAVMTFGVAVSAVFAAIAAALVPRERRPAVLVSGRLTLLALASLWRPRRW